jgi:ribosome-associated protein
MRPDELILRGLENEFVFYTSRSSGPGGQNINKVSTKVELRFNLSSTLLFSEDEKNLIYNKLRNKITRDGELIIVSQSERSQLLNKHRTIEKFYDLVAASLTIPIKRKATKPTVSSRQKRLENKKIRADVKKSRRRHDFRSE